MIALQVAGTIMLNWISNPFGINPGACVILWIALLVIITGSFITAIVKVPFSRK